MKITFNSNELTEVLKVFGKVINGKCSLPIGQCVKITRCGNGAILTGTNSDDTFISKTVLCDCEGGEKVCINYSWLKALVDNNVNATIHLNIDENSNKITASTIDGEIRGCANPDTAAFPLWRDIHVERTHIIPGRALVSAISSVMFARGTDEIRPLLTGVYLDSDGEGKMRAVATDGRVLAVKTFPAPDANELRTVIHKLLADILVTINPNEVTFNEGNEDNEGTDIIVNADGYTIRTQVIEGKYPNYQGVMPDVSQDECCKCSRASLVTALKKINIYGNQSSAKSIWNFGGNSLTVKSYDADYNTGAKEKLPCTCDFSMTLACSSVNVLNILARVSGGCVAIHLTAANKPLVFIGADDDLYLMSMPMAYDDYDDEPSDEEVSDEEVSNEEVPDEEVSDDSSDEEVSDEEVSNEEVPDEEVSDEPSDEEVSDDTDNFIDLGLPSGTLWADRNVGAQSPEEYGDYKTFDEAKELGAPTREQFEELYNNCTWEWCEVNGVNGYKVTGSNGNSIFLPAAGFRNGGSLNHAGVYGDYWSSSRSTGTPCSAYYLDFNSGGVNPSNYYGRYNGYSVRLVRSAQN